MKRKLQEKFVSENIFSFIPHVHCPLKFCMPTSRKSNWELHVVENMPL